MGDKNPKKQKKKKQTVTDVDLNQASLKPESGVEPVSNKQQMKQNRKK